MWTRWGRVGVIGQNALMGPLPLNEVLSNYEKKVKSKTLNGEYTIIEINTGGDEVVEQTKKGYFIMKISVYCIFFLVNL